MTPRRRNLEQTIINEVYETTNLFSKKSKKRNVLKKNLLENFFKIL